MNLPVFEMVINPEETSDVEVAAVAFVDKPAIEKNFMAFNSQRLEFAIDEEKRIVSGPAMISDQLIYRKDQNGEYNVFFSPQTVRDIAVKFFQKGYQKNLNLFHDPTLSLEGVTIFESFVTDKARGIQGMRGFEDLPDGSWFISAKVDNDEVWNKIKSGQVKGFSVEGIFSFLKKSENRPIQNNAQFQTENSFMSQLKELYNKFFGGPEQVVAPQAPASPAPEKLSQEIPLKDGTVLTVDRMEIGGVAMVNGVPAMPGVLEAADGSKITVGEGGVIQNVEVSGAPAPEAPVVQSADYSEQFKVYEEKLASHETKFQEHITAYNTLAQEFSQAKDQMKNLIALVGKIVETPTAESVQGNISQFNSQKPDRDAKIKELAQIFSTLKRK